MAEIKDQNEKELQKELSDKRLALKDFRFAGSGSKAHNVKEGRAHRKQIARILTELHARKAKA